MEITQRLLARWTHWLISFSMLLQFGFVIPAFAVGTNSGGGGNGAKQDFLRTGREVQNWLDENGNGERIRPQVNSNDIAEALNPDRVVPVQNQIFDPKIQQWVDCYYDEATDTFLVYGIDGRGWLALKEKPIKWRLFLHEIFRKLHRTMPRYDDDKYKITTQIEILAFKQFDFSKVRSGDYERDHGNAGAYYECIANVGTDPAHQRVTLSMSRGCVSTAPATADNYTVNVIAQCSENTKYGSACVAPFELALWKGDGGFFSSKSRWEKMKTSMVLTFNQEGDIIVTFYDANGNLLIDHGMRLRKK